jgi:hypothetical protein
MWLMCWLLPRPFFAADSCVYQKSLSYQSRRGFLGGLGTVKRLSRWICGLELPAADSGYWPAGFGQRQPTASTDNRHRKRAATSGNGICQNKKNVYTANTTTRSHCVLCFTTYTIQSIPIPNPVSHTSSAVSRSGLAHTDQPLDTNLHHTSQPCPQCSPMNVNKSQEKRRDVLTIHCPHSPVFSV